MLDTVSLNNLATAASDGALGHWAALVTLLAEGLVIAAMVIGGISALYRRQKKKDAAEEAASRALVHEEVRYQLDEFKFYFDSRLDQLTSGVSRTVNAVERNGGSAIPDALSRLEKSVRDLHNHVEQIDSKVEEFRAGS